ncbi:MAG: GNAT family N-acetyltransferase [Pseudomonadota bacterium]
MVVNLRPGRPEDAHDCGVICYEAFKAIAEHHRFAPDFPSADTAIGLMSWLLSSHDIFSVVAEFNGRVVGSNFLWEKSSIAGVGPITVDANAQNSKVGRALMERVLERSQEQRFSGVRLLQAAYHNRSLSLYTKLGFEAREPISVIQGSALSLRMLDYPVRAANESDLDACNRICFSVHGHHRKQELMDAVGQGTATVVEYGGQITGYATAIGFFGHAVAQSNDALKALIGAAAAFSGPGFLLPTRNGELLRWCLGQGLIVIQPMTLMSVGLYNEPAGSFLPSILF